MPIQIDRFESTVEIAEPARGSATAALAPAAPARDMRGVVREILADEIARHLRARGLRG